ncbi:MAG: hypothetical protein M4579_007454, partial [Chaenotheca gracillima]
LVLMHARKMIQLENPPDFIEDLPQGSVLADRCFLGPCHHYGRFDALGSLLEHLYSHHYDINIAHQDAYILLAQNSLCYFEELGLTDPLALIKSFGSFKFPVLRSKDFVPTDIDRGRNLVQRNTRKPVGSQRSILGERLREVVDPRNASDPSRATNSGSYQNRMFAYRNPGDSASLQKFKADRRKPMKWWEGPDLSQIEDFLLKQGNTQLPNPISKFSGKPIWHAPVPVLENWSGRGKDVAFGIDERLPFEERRFLGRGANAEIHEIVCKGVILARKRMFCTRKARLEDMQGELKVLGRLRHLHVINLIGSYTHGSTFGLLLWPVAVCDLSKFLDMTDNLGSSSRDGLWGKFGIPDSTTDDQIRRYAGDRLQAMFGCTASATNYLHSQKIRHKDLKPANILLTKENMYVTDFGMSKDFSDASTSASNGIERGTIKYSAPEVIRYESHGRAADIFSLGCIYLEMVIVWGRVPYSELDEARTRARDNSFQANVDAIPMFRHRVMTLATVNRIDIGAHITQTLVFDLIIKMMAHDPNNRPSAIRIIRELTMSDAFRRRYNPQRNQCKCMKEQIYNESPLARQAAT